MTSVMKRFLAIICLLLSFVSLSAQQIRRVYITLDVSGSMRGDKYTLANYTAQMIATLCDPEDEVYLIIGGKPTHLTGGAGQLKDFQHPLSHYGSVSWEDSEFNDIQAFCDLYKASSKKQDWLFIIGDGEWFQDLKDERPDLYAGLEPRKQRFLSVVKESDLHVCFLQIGTVDSDFLKFVTPVGTIDVKKTNPVAGTIRANCDYFARKILGFSDIPLKVNASGKNGISVKSELPLSEFIVVYQLEAEAGGLPGLQSASAGGMALGVSLKGTPSTSPVRTSSDARLSGNVWKVTSSGFIPAGELIELAFDKAVNPKNITVFPVVKEMDFASFGLTTAGNALKRLDANVLSICEDEKKAVVKVGLSDVSRQLVPEELLRQTKVEIKANNRSYPAKYENGAFVAEINLIDDETQYYAEIDCPGYFKRVTSITTIRKVKCEEAQPEVKHNSVSDLGTMSFEQLKSGEVSVIIRDEETGRTLDPSNFDIDVDVEDGFMFEDPRIRIEGDEIHIGIIPRGDWCECLFPKDLTITVFAKQSDGSFIDEGKQYNAMEQPFRLTIEKDRPWFSRCLWVIIALAGLLLLLIYFRALLKKHRFKKTARISSVYYNYYGAPVQGTGGRYLREEGFGAWLSRWFSPIDEKVTLSWSKPAVSAFTLVASDSKDIVNIPKKTFSAKTMNLPGYDAEDEDTKEKFIPWGDGETINVSRREGGKDGDLTFVAGEEDDGTGFRFLIGILFVLCLIAFAILAWMMIRSIF